MPPTLLQQGSRVPFRIHLPHHSMLSSSSLISSLSHLPPYLPLYLSSLLLLVGVGRCIHVYIHCSMRVTMRVTKISLVEMLVALNRTASPLRTLALTQVMQPSPGACSLPPWGNVSWRVCAFSRLGIRSGEGRCQPLWDSTLRGR